MANGFVQHGNTVTFVAPTGGVVNGKLYMIGTLPMVADHDAAVGELCEGHTVGVWEFPKVSADAPAQFAKAYLLADGSAVGVTASGNKLIGTFTESFKNGDTVCTVRLNGTTV